MKEAGYLCGSYKAKPGRDIIYVYKYMETGIDTGYTLYIK